MCCGIFIIGQILSLLEIIIVVRYVIQCLGWKEEAQYRRTKILLLVSGMYFIAQGNGRFWNSHFLIICADIILLVILSRIYLRGSIQLQIFECTFPFFVIAVVNVFLMQLFAFLNETPVGVFMNQLDSHFLIPAILSKVILWYVLRVSKHFFRSTKLFLSDKYHFIVNILSIVTVTMEAILFYVMNVGSFNTIANKLLITVCMGIILTSTYIGYSVFKISSQNEKILKYELLQLKNQEKERQIQEFERAESRVKQLRHDYKNHCLNMQSLLEKKKYVELEEYLQGVSGRYLLQSQDFISTKNEIVDTVINTKIYQCQEYGIQITCFITGDISGIRDLEFGIILFNLLDNAIEAILKSQEPLKQIEIKISKEKDLLNIVIQNTISKSVLSKNKKLVTNKADKELHGIGHATVEELVNEAGGMIEYYEENSMFCVHVLVPV